MVWVLHSEKWRASIPGQLEMGITQWALLEAMPKGDGKALEALGGREARATLEGLDEASQGAAPLHHGYS